MTTSSFGTPLAEAPAGPPSALPSTGGEDAARSRRNVIVLAAVAAALALGAGLYFLLFAGSGTPDVVAAPPAAPAPVAAAPTAVASVTPAPVLRQKAVKARNPFIALVESDSPTGAQPGTAGVAPGAGPVGGTPVVATPVTRVPVAAVPVTPVPVTRAPTTVIGAVPAAPVAPVAAPRPPAITVKLGTVSADNTVAVLTVAGKAVRVLAGAEFGTDYRLLNLRDGSCGAVQLGSVVVDLCEGKSYTTR